LDVRNLWPNASKVKPVAVRDTACREDKQVSAYR
jgi:hypothetical protein